MTSAPLGLLDTSVFIAVESGRDLAVAALPDRSVICPITVAELQAGVLAAADVDVRARRMATLDSIADVEILPITAHVAAVWAQMRVHLAQAGRRVNANDLWVAATAASHQIPVVTQDDDFDPVDGMAGLAVVKV